MTSWNQVFASLQKGYDEAYALLEAGDIVECAAAARPLLAETNIPTYHRVKTWLLLAACKEEWSDWQNCVNQADMMWAAERRLNSEGEDAAVEEALTQLHKDIDHVMKQQQESEPVRYNYPEKYFMPDGSTRADTPQPEPSMLPEIEEEEMGASPLLPEIKIEETRTLTDLPDTPVKTEFGDEEKGLSILLVRPKGATKVRTPSLLAAQVMLTIKSQGGSSSAADRKQSAKEAALKPFVSPVRARQVSVADLVKKFEDEEPGKS